MTFERKKYLVLGSREKWLREQKEAQLRMKNQSLIHVKGHYRIIQNKKVFVRPYYRKRKTIK